MKTILLLNPFSHSLGKNPLMKVNGEPAYSDGDYKVYQHYGNHFVHTFKNIVIAERGKINKHLITGLKNNISPNGEASIYHDFERPLWAKNTGLKIAKQLNFSIH